MINSPGPGMMKRREFPGRNRPEGCVVSTARPPVPPEPKGPWSTLFAWIEYVMAWVVYGLARSATFKVASGLVILILTVVLVLYVVEWPDRQRARQHLQWLVLADMGERPGDHRVIFEILEDLNRHDSESLAGLRLREKTLAGINLSGARLSGSDFSGTDFSEADFTRAELSDVIFTGCDLNRVVLDRARLVGATIRGATLLKADLRRVDGREADFSRSDLRGANLDGAFLHMARFQEADLTDVDLGMPISLSFGPRDDLLTISQRMPPDLRLADFSGARMSGVNLSGASLEGNRFPGADLTAANLRGAQLRQADFSGATLDRADLRRSLLIGCNFRKATFAKARLNGTDFSGADLTDADLDGAYVGRVDWLDWLSGLPKPPVDCERLLQAWRVVDHREQTSLTRFVIRARQGTTATGTGD